MMSDILENRRLSRWAALLTRKPDQHGAGHESDAELVPLGDGRLLALTIDQVVEEVTLGLYRLPETVGRIAATASLSDLAAVGADVVGLLTAVTLPSSDFEAVQNAVARGLREVAVRANAHILGGDTSEGPMLSITCAAVGTLPHATMLTRVGANPGDTIYATGPLGLGAALAAVQLLGMPEVLLTEAEFCPALRLDDGRALRGVASCCMDTSDGLLATLDQLARLNRVAFIVDADPVSLLHPKTERIRAALSVGALPLLAAPHGEFELVFTVAACNRARFHDLFSVRGSSPLRLGTVAAGNGVEIGGRQVDTTRVRNLTHHIGDDPRLYFEQLVEICRHS